MVYLLTQPPTLRELRMSEITSLEQKQMKIEKKRQKQDLRLQAVNMAYTILEKNEKMTAEEVVKTAQYILDFLEGTLPLNVNNSKTKSVVAK
jgi:HEPN domain-containing protein